MGRMRLVLAIGALVLSSAGTAAAVLKLPAGSVTSKALRDGGVRGTDLGRSAARSGHVRDRSLRRADVAASALGAVSAQSGNAGRGPAGVTGAPGLSGERGRAGSSGAPGDVGDPGVPGPTGGSGPMGPQGLVGGIGPDGNEGKPGIRGGLVQRVLVDQNAGPIDASVFGTTVASVSVTGPDYGEALLLSASLEVPKNNDNFVAMGCELHFQHPTEPAFEKVVDSHTISLPGADDGSFIVLQGGIGKVLKPNVWPFNKSGKAWVTCKSPLNQQVAHVTLSVMRVDTISTQ